MKNFTTKDHLTAASSLPQIRAPSILSSAMHGRAKEGSLRARNVPWNVRGIELGTI